MAQDEEIWRLAEDGVENFIVEWRVRPHRWWYEADVACEIARRVSSLLEKQNLALVPEDNVRTEGCTCGEAGRVRVNWPGEFPSDGTRFAGDVTVVGDRPTDPCEWICEIKCGDSLSGSEDHAKARRYLVEQRALHACILELSILASPPRYRGREGDDRLSIYRVQARTPSPS